MRAPTRARPQRAAGRPGGDGRGVPELHAYARRLGVLQRRCHPFGRDYLALGIALESLVTAAFHFTREPNFYGACSDFAGPIRQEAPPALDDS